MNTDLPVQHDETSSFDEQLTIPETAAVLDELEQVARRPSKKKIVLVFAGFLLLGIVIVAGLLILARNNTTDDEVSAADNLATTPTEGEGSNTLVAETATITQTNIVALSSPTPSPTVTPIPSPTPLPPTPAPAQVSIVYPEIVPNGLPQHATWLIGLSEGDPVQARVVDFGGAMLTTADPETVEVIISKQIASGSEWELHGYIDPQMTQGALILEFVSQNGVSETISLPWKTGDVATPVNGRLIEPVDGQSPAVHILPEQEIPQYHLPGSVTVSLPPLPDQWTAHTASDTILVYLTADHSEQDAVTIATLQKPGVSHPEQALDYLLDADNGAGGVTTYGELVVDDVFDNPTTLMIGGYPSAHVLLQTSDGQLYGLLAAVIVEGNLVVVQAFSSTIEGRAQIFNWIGGLILQATN